MNITNSLPMYHLEKHPSEKNNFQTIYKKSKSVNLSNSNNYENWFKTPEKTESELLYTRPKINRNSNNMKELNKKLDDLREELKVNNSYFNTDKNMTVKNKNLKKRKLSRKPLRKYKRSKSKKILKRNNNNNNHSRKSLSYNSVLFSPKPVKKPRPAWKPPGNAKKIRLG